MPLSNAHIVEMQRHAAQDGDWFVVAVCHIALGDKQPLLFLRTPITARDMLAVRKMARGAYPTQASARAACEDAAREVLGWVSVLGT